MNLEKIMIIGITGKSGTGKSYLSEIIAEKLDMIHIDIDKISHEVLTFPETKEFLKAEFGESVFDDGIVNRKKIGAIVFNNKTKLNKLNDFCQKLIEKKLDEIISNSQKSIILDYALLPRLKQFNSCDLKILLHSDFETRFIRVAKRENITKDYFLSRDGSIEDFKNTSFDFVFENINDTEIARLIDYIKTNKKRSFYDKKNSNNNWWIW